MIRKWLVLVFPALLIGCGSPTTEAPMKSLKPTQFSTVAEMIEDRGDFSEELGTFKVLSSSPLHIQLSPRVVNLEDSLLVMEAIYRAALYGVYRTFIHTDHQFVRVTAVPMVFSINPVSLRLADGPVVDISANRKSATLAINKFIKVKSLSELVESGSGLDSWSVDFEKIYYSASSQRELMLLLGNNKEK